MIPAAAPLVDLLHSSRQFRMADCLTIITPSATYRWTSADVPVILDGVTYRADGPIITRSSIRISAGLEVDSLKLRIAPRSGNTIEGLPMGIAGTRGALDGARVELRRAFLTDWGVAAVGGIFRFGGRISDVNPSRTQLEIEAKSDVELLNIKVPRNLYQPPCVKSVYSPPCGVSRAAFTVAGTVTGSGHTETSMSTNLTAQAANYFDRGVVIFKTGANAGLRRTVKSFSGGVFKFVLPLPNKPAAGDTFDTYPGCDRTKATCVGRFNNGPRFKAYRFVPKPEAAA